MGGVRSIHKPANQVLTASSKTEATTDSKEE
jgi:hypothetical protein